MKKCFTINCMRTREDFIDYDQIITDKIFQGVELFYPYNVDDDQTKLYTEEVTKLVNNHQELEVVLHLPHGGSNNLVTKEYAINDVIIQRMKDAITYASQFRVKKLTLHLGSAYQNYSCDRQKLIDKVIEALNILCDYAKQYEMNVMVENMPRDVELGYSVDELEYIFQNSKKDNLKFILDTGHAHVSSYEVTDYIIRLSKYLYHMHFSDNHGSTDEHKPINTGTIDFVKVFTELNKINYNELHCLEILFNKASDQVGYAKTIEEYNYLYK